MKVLKSHFFKLPTLALMLTGSLLPAGVQAESGTLPANAYLYSCPFYHRNSAQFTTLLNTARTLLTSKIEDNRFCNAPLSRVVSHLNTISLAFQDSEPDLQATISIEALSAYLNDLQAQKTQLELAGDTSSYTYSNTVSAIFSVQSQLIDARINQGYAAGFSRESRKNSHRRELFQTLNEMVLALKSTDPSCFSGQGAWESIAPALIGAASLASGFSGFASGGQAITASAIAIAANIADYLRDTEAKNALGRVNTFENAQLLECTYYAMKYSACELRRAHALSRDTSKIRDLIRRRYEPGVPGEWEELFRYREGGSIYSQVYQKVASMGTPITLNTSLLVEYIEYLQIDPYSIEPIAPGASDTEMQIWLAKLSSRGIGISPMNSTGGRRSLAEMVTEAKLIIENAKSKIAAVEQIISLNQSFIDLRAELDAKYPGFLADVRNLNSFLETYIGKAWRQGSDPGLQQGAGSMLLIQEVLKSLEAFLAVRYEQNMVRTYCVGRAARAGLASEDIGRCEQNTPVHAAYAGMINEKGFALFQAMASGAVAQITKQSVLAIAAKITERQARALQIVENHFLAEDRRQGSRAFTDFLRDRALYAAVVDNYEQFQGPNQTNLVDSVNTTLQSFEDGFGPEILDFLEQAMSSESAYLPELNGRTGAHLCSLFATALKRKTSERHFFGNRARKVLARCQNKYRSLPLIEFPPENGDRNLTGAREVAIDWNDPCFYPNYGREFEMQRLTLDKIKQQF